MLASLPVPPARSPQLYKNSFGHHLLNRKPQEQQALILQVEKANGWNAHGIRGADLSRCFQKQCLNFVPHLVIP